MNKNEYSFVIPLETPSKKNSRIVLKNGKNIPSEKYQQWHRTALLFLSSQKRPSVPIDYPIKISIIFTHSDNKRRDCDNQTSSILDLLQDSNIIKDDTWQIVNSISIDNWYKKDCPECYIKITNTKMLDLSSYTQNDTIKKGAVK